MTTKEQLSKLKPGDYSAICKVKGNCVININRSYTKRGNPATNLDCTFSDCCSDCIIVGGEIGDFDIIELIR